MRKILSFVAAMFVALAVNAQELPSTDFAAPGYSCAADAAVLSGTATELSGKFYLDETASPHHIAWSDLSKQYTAVATWHFHASRACYVTVTLDLGPVIASNKHIFDVELHAANGDRLDTIAEGPNYTGDGFTDANVQKTLEGQILIPAAGDYYIELRNNRDWCKGSIKNVILTYAADAPVIGAPAYYLVGSMNNWTPADEYKFEENPGTEGEYMLTAALAVGDSLKVLGIVGATQTWYPDNAANYGIDAAHAGESKKIYFRPNADGGEGWYHGVIFVEENQEPDYQVAVLEYTGGTTTNLVGEGANNAEILGLDANLFTVLADKGENQNLPGLNQANDIRLYADKNTGNGNSITVSIANGTILSIALDIKQTATFVVKAGETAVPEAEGVYAINGTSFSIQNTTIGATTQLRLNKITINYTADEPIIGEPAYFLVGTMNEWTPAEAYKFEENPGTEGEYMLTAALAVGDSLKVLGIVGATQTWYPDNAANYGIDAAHAGESKKIYFRPNADGGEGWYHGVIFVEENQEPAGCDWNNIEFLGSTDAQYANQFKVCVASELDPQVVNIQQGFGDEIGIYCQGFANADFQSISVPEGKYSVQGAGIIFHISYFTAKETEVEVICGGGGHFVYQFTVLNVNGEEPAINYSLKNNWDAAADWTWKEMTKDGDNYKLDSVVFGGTGVNYKADLLGAPEIWVPMADFLGDKVDAKDTVTFVLNPADSTITATLIGKYIEPQPEMTVIYNWAKDSADQVGATIFGGNSNITTGTVKIHENTDDVNGIKFGSSYVYADGKWIAIKPAEGGFKAGDILSVSVVFNNSDATKYCMVDLRAADGDTRIWMSDSLSTLNGRNAGEPIVQTYTLEADQDSLFLGRYGNTGMFVTLLKVDRAVAPEPVHTYTVAGAPATLFGQEWAPSYAANDLEPIVGGEYTHGWKKDSVALAAGKVEFKIVEDHAWAHAWPAQNYVLNIPEAGLYNITILFNQYAEADSLRILATADKVGEAVVIPTVVMHGTFTNPNWATTDPFTLAADSLTASLKLNLEAKTYEFGMKFDGVWKANGANITREAPSACLATGDGNMHMTADQAGEYTFTYTFATQTLEVAYPELIVLKNCLEVYSMAKNDVVNLNPVTVTYVNGKNVFVKDEAGAMLLYMPNTNFAWKAGDQLTGLVAPIDIYNGLYELKPDTNQVKNVIVAEGAAPAPEEKTFISDSLDMNKYIVVRGIEFAADTAFVTTKSTTININVGNQAIDLYNKFKLAYAFEAGKKYDIVAAVSYYNALQLYFISAEESVARPTTAPAVPTAAEDDVMAIYCNHYTNNNLNFVIAGYGGAFEDLMIENTRVGYKRNMTWDCVIDPINTDSIHDLSGYKKLHADFWAPEAAKVKFTAEAVAGGNYKDGVVVDLNAGWNCLDFVVAEWPGEYNFSNLKCFVLEQYKTPEGESFENNPFGFANIYFYDKKAEGFENIDASVKAVKVLQNGQIFILRGDKVYTVTGQPIAK